MLRVRAAEEEAAAGRKDREELRAALDEQRGPWFDEVQEHDPKQLLRIPHQLAQLLNKRQKTVMNTSRLVCGQLHFCWGRITDGS